MEVNKSVVFLLTVIDFILMTVVCSADSPLCWHVSDDVCGTTVIPPGKERYTICDQFSIFSSLALIILQTFGVVKGVWALHWMLWLVISACHLIYWCFWGLQVTNADIACTYPSSPMYPFAFRTHTHSLGEILLYCSYIIVFTFYGASICWSCLCVLFFR